MKAKKVFRSKHLPTRLPIYQTIVIVLSLDYYKVPQWGWGVGLTLIALGWIGCIISKLTEEGVDISELSKEEDIEFLKKGI